MKELTYTRLSFANEALPSVSLSDGDDSSKISEAIKESIEKGEKCNIKGRIVLQRVSF